MVTEPSMTRCGVCGTSVASNLTTPLGGRIVCVNCKPRVAREMAGAPATLRFRYAGFWIRFAASLIDGIVLGGVIFAIMFAVMLPILMNRGPEPGIGFQLLMNVVIYGLQGLYYVLMHGLYGASLGKMAVGIKVIRPDGSPIGVPLAIGRYFAWILSGCIVYIGFIMAAFDEEKRSLHDRICDTRVVYK